MISMALRVRSPRNCWPIFGMVFPVGFSAFHMVGRMPVDNFGNGLEGDGRVLQRMIRQMRVSLFHGVLGGKQNGAVV